MLKPHLKIKNIPLFVALLSVALFSQVFFASCSNTDAPDVSNIEINLVTKRLDKDLYSIDTNNIGGGLRKLKEAYPDFLDFYLDTLLGFGIEGNYHDTAAEIQYGLRSFLTHKDYRGLYDTVAAHFPDTKTADEQLTRGFRYMKHYYPNYHVPQIIYLVTGLNNYGAFTYGDNFMGIGLDMFLGAGYPYYKSVGIPEYMGPKLSKEYIPVAAFRAIHQASHPFRPEGSTLLSMMIQRGKEMYFTKKMLPFLPDHILLGFTDKQLEWCEENEGMVFNFFASQNMFYETDWQKILRYVNEAPTAAGMPPESPGNIGSWMGWQIVHAYAERHPDLSLEELMSLEEKEQTFLQKSKYKPR